MPKERRITIQEIDTDTGDHKEIATRKINGNFIWPYKLDLPRWMDKIWAYLECLDCQSRECCEEALARADEAYVLAEAGGGGGGGELATFQYRENSGATPASCVSGSWQTVPIGTTVHNGISGALLSSNVITLPAGSYLLRYWVQFETGVIGMLGFEGQCRIFDNAGSVEVANSGGSVAHGTELSGGGAIRHVLISHGAVEVSPELETDYVLEARVNITNAYGNSSAWTSQPCAQIEIVRL